MMKFWKIFRFEFAYQVRGFSAWLYLAVLLAFTIVMALVITPGDGVYVNNTFHIIAVTVIGGLIWLVMGAAIAGEAAARDVHAGMHSLTFALPVTKLHYLGGRFLAALVVNALLILSLPIGILGSFYLPGIKQPGLGPFMPSAYLSVYFLIALPNVFIATAIQFTFAALSRKAITSYFASLLLAIFAQIIAITVAKLFGNWDLVILLDPVGVAGIVGNELQTWTATEKNTRLITLEGVFLWNRVMWLSVAMASLYLIYVRFNFSSVPTSNSSRFNWKRKVQATTSLENSIVRTTAISVPRINSGFGFPTSFHQTLRIALVSFGNIARNPAGLTIVAAIAFVSAAFGSRIITQFDIPLLPTTQQVLVYLTAPVSHISSPWVVIPLLIIYFTGQLFWRERDAGLTEIADAAPVSEWVLLTGKFLGLVFIIIVWMAFIMTGGILMQLSLGSVNIDIGLYLQVIFGLQLTDYLLFALLALVVHVVVNQKYIGYLVMFVVFIFIAFPATFQVEHTMLIFGADPGWSFTDMRGFGATLGPWLWFKVYWIAWAMVLAVTARLLWVRGREHNLKYRLQLAKRRFAGATVGIAITALGLVITLASFIFYNTNVLNKYQTSSDILESKAKYERRYGQYRNTPQPQLTATKLQVEIFPDDQQVEIRAAYTLVNMDSVPMDSIHVGSISGVEFSDVHFSRPAAGVVLDKELSYSIYKLDQPLRPGDSLQLNFRVHHQPRGFVHSGTNALVVDNGTYFTNYDLLPAIGYQHHREMKDPVKRKQYNLPARPSIPSLYDGEARKRSLTTDRNTFEAIVSTSIDEVAVAPGALHKTWTAVDRRYFHYKTDVPIGGEYAILSGNYALQESKWDNPDSSGQVVTIRIYYHPDHDQNIDRMLRSVKASLEYFTEQFGPYPYGHITLVERAGSGGGASADASMINYGEEYSLMNPDDSQNGFDLPYYILAHEVAHQWWGLARLTPANVEGAGVLIEGLAVYSGMLVLEKSYGEGHLQQYVNFLHSSYEKPRSLATASLLQANESFLYYRKGGLAMYTLSRYIGKEKVNGALRSLLEKHVSGEIPLPTTIDLYEELQSVTPDTLNYLLHDLFKTNTYWRLKTKQFSASQTKAGNWKLMLKVQAQKVVVDSTGNETEVPINDWLEVGVYEEDNGSPESLYLQMHRIRSGEQTISIIVPRKPKRAGIDPNHLMIDLRREDNVMQLDEE
jgi:ABC-2 type transport system permease protein